MESPSTTRCPSSVWWSHLPGGVGHRRGGRGGVGAAVGRVLGGAEPTISVYPYQIAFNCLPHIDVFLPDGSTKEEQKMIDETKKIMGDDSIAVTATCVRVPVVTGHSEAVNLEFAGPMDPNVPGSYWRTPQVWSCATIRLPRLSAGDRCLPGPTGLRWPHPARQYRGTRTQPLGGVRQRAQGGGAQRRTDRRAPSWSEISCAYPIRAARPTRPGGRRRSAHDAASRASRASRRPRLVSPRRSPRRHGT